jgi:hypothetical protein
LDTHTPVVLRLRLCLLGRTSWTEDDELTE